MNGILVVEKEKDMTSRDVVNKISKILNTKKIGHTGTLDPMATGVLVLCIGTSLKLVELLTNHDKEYIAKIKLGIETDTLDITGNIIKKSNPININEERIKNVLQNMIGKIKQQVPLYSSVKVNGKKLYQYARNHEEVTPPERMVEIYDLQLLDNIKNNEFTIKCHVSKGTYIRSLVRDIGYQLGTYATLTELERTRVGKFKLESSFKIKDIEEGNYQLLTPLEVLDLPKIKVDKSMEYKIKNGQVLPKFFKEEMALILNEQGTLIAIYQQKENNLVKPYRMF